MTSKYNAKKTEIDGIVFDSKREAARYQELKLMEKAGAISDLVLQPEFVLQDGFMHNGKKIRPITYRADFSYKETGGGYVVEDVKGMETVVFKLKRKMFYCRYPAVDFRIVK